MIVIKVFGSFLHHRTKTKRQKKKKKKKTNVKRYQSWTPSDKTFWIRHEQLNSKLNKNKSVICIMKLRLWTLHGTSFRNIQFIASAIYYFI